MNSGNLLYTVEANIAATPASFREMANATLMWIVIAIIVLMMVKFIVTFISERKTRRSTKDRKSLKGMRELAVKQKLEEELTVNTKVSSRHKFERLASQAGLYIRYGEYRLICLLSALVLPILTLMFMRNIYMALAMIFVGAIIPGQVISAIRNRRVGILDRQVESFMELFVERYKLTQSPSMALEGCVQDLVGQQPLYGELQRAISEMDTGDPTLEVFERFAERTANKYLMRMATSLKMAEDIGTSDAREMLMSKALLQYRNNKTLRNTLKERIEGPKRESMILLIAVPGVVIYQAIASESYVDFMLHEPTGKIGCVVILLSCMACTWFINKKIGAPIN